MDELRDLVLRDYAINGRRSAGRARAALDRLARHFDVVGLKCLHDIASKYVLTRTREKAAPATIRYELAILRRALNLAFRAGRIPQRPVMPGIRVQNARTGFFDPDELELVIAALADPIDDMARFAWVTGWRSAEIRSLTWEQVDRRAGVVRLDPGTTKNGDGRSFPYGAHPELSRLIAWRYTHRSGPFVFHRKGQRVKHFLGEWNRACRVAGVRGRLFHDLRRSAVRNMERAGIPRSVQMTLVGFKTESIHRRYAITNENDLAPWVQFYADHAREEKEAPADGAGVRSNGRARSVGRNDPVGAKRRVEA